MSLWKSLLRLRRSLSREPRRPHPGKSRRPALECLEGRLVPASVFLSGGTLNYYDGYGVANNLTVSVANNAYTFNDTAETILASGFAGSGTHTVTVLRGSFSQVTIDLIDGNDTVNIESCADYVAVVKHAGSDTVGLSAVAKNQDNIGGIVEVDGDGSDKVTMYDQSNYLPHTYRIEGTTVWRDNIEWLDYFSCNGLELDAGSGGIPDRQSNIIDVNATGAQTTTIKGGVGTDRIVVSASAEDLDLMKALNIDGGGGTNILSLYDTFSGEGRNYNVSANTITESSFDPNPFAPINYSSITQLIFYDSNSSAGNYFNVNGLAAGTTTTINASYGYNSIYVGGSSGLSPMKGAQLNVVGTASASDYVIVLDQAYGGGDVYTLTGSTLGVQRLPGFQLAYNTVNVLYLYTGSGSDTFNVTPGTTPLSLSAGTPTAPTAPGDTLNLNVSGAPGPHLSFSGPGSGQWSSTNGSSVWFDGMETITPGATLPYSEDFNDGVADYLMPRSGTWSVSSGRYNTICSTPSPSDVVSTLVSSGALPSSLEVDVTMNADAATGGFYSNGFLVFDYKSATDFKYAGAFVGNQTWVIGHRDASGWHNDSTPVSDGTIAAGKDMNLQLLLQGAKATLVVGGVTKTSFTYASAFSGSVGLGTWNGLTQFDNLTVKSYP